MRARAHTNTHTHTHAHVSRTNTHSEVKLALDVGKIFRRPPLNDDILFDEGDGRVNCMAERQFVLPVVAMVDLLKSSKGQPRNSPAEFENHLLLKGSAPLKRQIRSLMP